MEKYENGGYYQELITKAQLGGRYEVFSSFFVNLIKDITKDNIENIYMVFLTKRTHTLFLIFYDIFSHNWDKYLKCVDKELADKKIKESALTYDNFFNNYIDIVDLMKKNEKSIHLYLVEDLRLYARHYAEITKILMRELEWPYAEVLTYFEKFDGNRTVFKKTRNNTYSINSDWQMLNQVVENSKYTLPYNGLSIVKNKDDIATRLNDIDVGEDWYYNASVVNHIKRYTYLYGYPNIQSPELLFSLMGKYNLCEGLFSQEGLLIKYKGIDQTKINDYNILITPMLIHDNIPMEIVEKIYRLLKKNTPISNMNELTKMSVPYLVDATLCYMFMRKYFNEFCDFNEDIFNQEFKKNNDNPKELLSWIPEEGLLEDCLNEYHGDKMWSYEGQEPLESDRKNKYLKALEKVLYEEGIKMERGAYLKFNGSNNPKFLYNGYKFITFADLINKAHIKEDNAFDAPLLASYLIQKFDSLLVDFHYYDPDRENENSRTLIKA